MQWLDEGGKLLIPFAADAVEGNSIKEISCEREREEESKGESNLSRGH